MTDVFTVKKRSEVMAKIRSAGNLETELRLVKLLRANRITGWRRNQKLLGRPDFTFRDERLAVFVDGCFWHGCPRCYRRPKSNRRYWDAKVLRNRERDREVARGLKGLQWRVIRIWSHQLASPIRTVTRIRRALAKSVQ